MRAPFPTPPPRRTPSRRTPIRWALAILLALAGLCGLALPAAQARTAPARPAAMPDTLRGGTEGVYPPFSHHIGATLTGYDVDYINEVARRLGVKVDFVETPWDSMFAGLDAGRIDLIANQVSVNAERQARYDLSKPYVTSHGVVLARADDHRVDPLA